MLSLLLATFGFRPQALLYESFPSEDLREFIEANLISEMTFSNLPTSARLPATRGWDAHYWPSFRYGLLWRYFDEELSPLEKFEAAFGQTLATENPGEYSIGDLIALERERTTGMTSNWFGICDGSSEAALFFDEPTSVIQIGEITFYPFEIKALLSYFTAMSQPQRKTVHTGIRINFKDPIQVDENGRPFDSRARDINPGLFHLAVTNMLGLKERGIVADYKQGEEVLNFPIKGFKVLHSETASDEKTLAELRAYNPKASEFMFVKIEIAYADSHRVLEKIPDFDATIYKTYDYVLELDETGQIIGGEWRNESQLDHPDFLWISQEKSLNLREFSSDRLPKSLKVGKALDMLLNSPPVANCEELISKKQDHPDNRAAYDFFELD